MGLIVVFSLGLGVVLTMVSIVRDAFPHLPAADQQQLRAFSGSPGTASIDGIPLAALGLHVRIFPRSWKRILFAFLLAAWLLSVMLYPFWHGVP